MDFEAYRTSLLSGHRPCFVFGRSYVQIYARIPVILIFLVVFLSPYTQIPEEHLKLRDISGSHRKEYEDSCFLGS